jgi:hypothetical protein
LEENTLYGYFYLMGGATFLIGCIPSYETIGGSSISVNFKNASRSCLEENMEEQPLM